MVDIWNNTRLPRALASDSLAVLVRRSRIDPAFRDALIIDPETAALATFLELDEAELRALGILGGALFEADDAELERMARRSHGTRSVSQHEAQMLMEYREWVIRRTIDALSRLVKPKYPTLHQHFVQYLNEIAMLALMAPCLPAIDFAAAVCICLRGDIFKTSSLSVAGFLYYMGIGLFDDVIDHDLDVEWRDIPEEQISLTGIALFAGLPILALEEMWANDPERRHIGELSTLIHKHCYDMTVGQFLDIASATEHDTSLEKCMEIIELKTGSTGALMAKLMGTFLSAPRDILDAYARVCKHLYMSMQIASDIHDIWGKPVSPDLSNGIFTLPSLFACHSLIGADKEAFIGRFKSRDGTQEGHAELRRTITATGGLVYALLSAETLRQRVILELDATGAAETGKALFNYMIQVARITARQSRS